jgi:hypothetical protein
MSAFTAMIGRLFHLDFTCCESATGRHVSHLVRSMPRQVQAPVLVAGGIVEPPRMFARVNGPKRLWLLRAHNVDLEDFAPAECREHVLEFLIENLGSRDPHEPRKYPPSRY